MKTKATASRPSAERTRSEERELLNHAVAAVVSSGVLGKSERRAQLLHYLVDKEHGGQGKELKAYSIALDVFGRGSDFDPNTDSIVRTDVGRLRDGLTLFYAGDVDPTLPKIEIAKGTYRPTFSWAEPMTAQAAAAPRSTIVLRSFLVALGAALIIWIVYALMPDGPLKGDSTGSQSETPYQIVRIAIAPYESSGNQRNVDRLAFGLYSELSMDLSAYPWISVISPIGNLDPTKEIQADYVFKGSILWDDSTILVSSQIISLPDQVLIWTGNQTTSTNLVEIEQLQRHLAGEVVSELGSARGIAADLVKALNARSSGTDLEAFVCYLGAYQYIVAPSDELHRELRSCLVDVVAEFPNYGEAWAALGWVYMDEARYGRNPRPGADSWADAKKAIEKGLDLAPLRTATLNAAVIQSVEAPQQNLEDFRIHSNRLLELFPRHPGTLAVVGSRLAEFTGEWDRGLELVNQAIELEPRPPSWFFKTQAYKAVLQADNQIAIDATKPLTTRTSISELMLVYLAAARNDLPEMMKEYRGLLAEQNLVTDEDIIGFVKGRRYLGELEVEILRQLTVAFDQDDA